MKKIRIAYLTKDMPVNGISTVIMNYCRYLNKEKYDITIFSGPPIVEQYRKECEKLGIRIIETPPKKGGNPLKYYIFLLKNITKKKYDVVHIHGNSATITIELLITLLKGIKNRVGHCHNTQCDSFKVHKTLKPILGKIYTNGFACSKEAGEWMFGDKPFDVLPNGFITENFIFNQENRVKIRKKLKINDKFVIGHVGMFNEQKNHPFILNVFEKVAEKNDKAILLLVGTGPDYEKIQKIIDKHPYKEKIICYGVTDKVSEIYDAMDLFFFPSKFEGLGIVLLEAQIKGLPCIASDVIPKEVVLDNKLVDFLSLESNLNIWSESILKRSKYDNKDRQQVYKINQKAIKKYEITENVKYLENKYETMCKKGS